MGLDNGILLKTHNKINFDDWEIIPDYITVEFDEFYTNEYKDGYYYEVGDGIYAWDFDLYKDYDYDAYARSKGRYVMVTTNCLTGEANYFEEKESQERIMEIVRSSSSLPFVCPMAQVDGIPMLDGGIADSVPVEYAHKQGFTNSLVILTRNKGYRKKVKRPSPLAKLFYRKYPLLQDAINSRNLIYNRTMDLIDMMEEEGKITVLRPLKPLQVDRMEKDITKLNALYQEGYELASKICFE